MAQVEAFCCVTVGEKLIIKPRPQWLKARALTSATARQLTPYYIVHLNLASPNSRLPIVESYVTAIRQM